jgi:hypothetical protein
MEYFHSKVWIWANLILITCENAPKFTRCKVYLFTNSNCKTLEYICIRIFCGQVCQKKTQYHHTPPPPLTIYYIPCIYWKLSWQVWNIRTQISPCEGTHATTVNAADHVSSKKDKLKLNFIEHSPSPNFKVEMTYVWIRWSSIGATSLKTIE